MLTRIDHWLRALQRQSAVRRGAFLGTLFGLLLIVIAVLILLVILFLVQLGGR